MQAARSEGFDALRGMAVLLVIGHHHFGLTLGWTGPDIFFALSGYLLCGILLEQRTAPAYWRPFYARRAFRILPLYWLFLAVVCCFATTQESVWTYLTFTQTFAWALRGSVEAPPVGITWTLAIEEQFYLLLPVMVRFIPPRKLPWALLACAFAAPVWRLAFVLTGHTHAAVCLLPCRAEGLFGGAFLAAARLEGGRSRLAELPRWLGPAAVLCLAVGWSIGGAAAVTWFNVLLGFSAVSWVGVWLVFLTRDVQRLPAWLKPLVLLGLGSYAVYLSNDLIFELADNRGLGLIGTAAFAAFSWVVFEYPLVQFARRRWRYARPSPRIGLGELAEAA